MGMHAEENEILLIYNSGNQYHRELRGFAKSLEGYALNEKDLAKEPLTRKQIAEIAQDLSLSINDMLDKNHEIYEAKMASGDYSDEELLKIMSHNQGIIKTPIAYKGKKAFLVDTQYSFVNMGIEIEGVKSKKGNSFEKQ